MVVRARFVGCVTIISMAMYGDNGVYYHNYSLDSKCLHSSTMQYCIYVQLHINLHFNLHKFNFHNISKIL